jgi:hypothetical protein
VATPSGKRKLRSAAPPVVACADLPRMSQQELDALFSRSPAGPTPSGVADGSAIVAPGTPVGVGLVPLLHLAWQGKVFYPEQGDLLNRVGPFGLLIARARVYRDASWMDGREAIVLDYSVSSLPFRAVRDEIREVAPGLYLGVVYWVAAKTVNFSLRFKCAER